MSRFRVETDPVAAEEFDNITRWWRENRGNASRLEQEFAEAGTLLAERPYAGAPAEFIALGMRRLLLRRSRYYIYYVVDRAAGIVLIVAIWHTSRGSGPPLL